MTQDEPGYVARGEAGPDDATEASQAEQPGPMTRLKKVASALRGDRPDETVPDEAATTGPDGPGPGGEYADTAAPDEVGAVPAGGAGTRDYWDDEPDAGETAPGEEVAAAPGAGTGSPPFAAQPGGMAVQTRPDGMEAQDPSLGRPDMDEEADMATAPYADRGSQGGTAAGYGSPAGTAAGYGSQPGAAGAPGSMAAAGTTGDMETTGARGTMPGYGSQAAEVDRGSQAGTATGYAGPAGTGARPQDLASAGPDATGALEGLRDGPAEAGPAEAGPAEAGPAEAGAAGTGATGTPAAADDGLRPGEATERLGDFGDIAFGNLLPDVAEYRTQWQQIQFRFVDDPQGSVTEAAEVISQVTAKLEAAIAERQRAIAERQQAIQERATALRGRWGEGSNADTETLRETLRMYRAFMDQLIGPTP